MSRLIKLRYPSTCSVCDSQLAKSALASWDAEAKRATCATCAGSDAALGTAGGSARKVADRQAARIEAIHRERDDGLRERFPRVGGALVRVARHLDDDAPTSWQKGAAGEESFGAGLDRLCDHGLAVLHDRQKPGSKANIDHLVVGPRGVYVVDAKHYSGKLEVRTEGGFLQPKVTHLTVGGRNRRKLVDGMAWQVATVRDVVGERVDALGGTVRPFLCFMGVTIDWLAGPWVVGDVVVTWPKRFLNDIEKVEGPLSPEDIRAVAGALANGLPSAS
jgi:hypothetical protein